MNAGKYSLINPIKLAIDVKVADTAQINDRFVRSAILLPFANAQIAFSVRVRY